MPNWAGSRCSLRGMSLDPRTPVCIGAAAVMQRFDDPAEGVDAAGLMVQAARAAAADASVAHVLEQVQLVAVAGGSWGYGNAPRLVAQGIGSPKARTHMIALGVLQTGLLDRALGAIARGEIDTAVVCGGEAKWRELRGRITGQLSPDTDDAGAPAPDEVLRPHGRIISEHEIARRMVDAPTHYALIENARRVADQQSVADHARVVADLWSRFNVIAQANPDAWNRSPMTPEAIALTTAKNRLIAYPYNKWHVSQLNVDQAAALLFCSVARAEALGVPRDRWVFPHAIVDSNYVVPVSERAVIHRSPGFAHAGARAFALAGVGVDDIAHVDLYSCFPIAVRTQALELGLRLDRPLTVTGGMTFGGGPLGNYVVQSTAKMMHVLRDDPASRGLVTGISGMITKQGVSIWSTEPPTAGYRFDDVSALVAPEVAVVATVAGVGGDGVVVTFTVNADEAGPSRSIAVIDRGDGTRVIASSDDRALATHLMDVDGIGARVRVHADDSFTLA